MQEFKAHESWTSRSSFLLASIGAAVGLGNIWKFPYITGANGGSAFVLVYLLCILFIALPILIAEINLGRMGKQSPPRSVANVARKFGRSGKWSIVGWLGILSAYLVASYYSVIAGWTLVYLFKNGNGNFVGQAADAIGAQFTALQASPAQMALWQGVFLFTTTFILTRGLREGIEKAVNWMMPVLFALLLIMLAYAFFEGDMKAGLNFLFDFDLGAINGHVVLMAIGHAFFSVGVAMGLMMGFGAYLDDDISIGKSALIIAGTDT
ncbi:MAG TPA: sodium-dependent transporter, partial [Xanthomonadales bacterium]|nr:sodium-dependent transporter [Xanthomonadales bacterium]